MFRYLPALCAVCIFSAPALAQTTPAKTTKSGVYTREQATRGQGVFVTMCKNCHTPESHTAEAFQTKWNGKPLSELYDYIGEQMPKNAPGTLTAEEYADVLAYLLRLNRMPAGDDELPPDAAPMKTIRIDTRPAGPTAVRKDP